MPSLYLGLFDNSQRRSTNKLLVLVPHVTPHGTIIILAHGKPLPAVAKGPQNAGNQ